MIQVIPFQYSDQPGYLPLLTRGLADLSVLRLNTARIEAQINTGLEIKLLREKIADHERVGVWENQDIWFGGEINADHELLGVTWAIFDPILGGIIYSEHYVTSETKFLSDWEDHFQVMVDFLTQPKDGSPEPKVMVTHSLDAFLEFRKGLEILSQSKKTSLREEGIEHLLTAVGYDPEFLEAADILLLFMIQNNMNQNFDYCIDILERLRTYTQSHPRIPLVMAEIYLQWGNTEKAEALFEEVTTRFPGFEEGWLRLALYYQSQENYPAALNALEMALEKDPENSTALDLTGAIYVGLEEHEKAESVWLRALQIDPERVNILNNLGLLAEENDNVELAETYYRQAIQLNNQWWGSFYNFGSFCNRSGRVEEAAVLLSQANALNTSHYPTSLLLAEVCIKLGRFTEAEEALIQVLQIAPNNSVRRQALQMLEHFNTDTVQTELQIRKLERCWEDGERLRVIAALAKYYIKARKCWYYWYLWSVALDKLRLGFLAAGALKIGLHFNPGYALLKKLGLLYWGKAAFDKALPLLRSAYTLHQSDPETVRAYLQTLINTGAVEEYQDHMKHSAHVGNFISL